MGFLEPGAHLMRYLVDPGSRNHGSELPYDGGDLNAYLISLFIVIAKKVNSNGSGKSQSEGNSPALDLGSLLIAPDCTSVQMAS